MGNLDERLRILLGACDASGAATMVLRELGPEVFGFLTGVLGRDDADEVFAVVSERLWRSLKRFEGRCSIRTWLYLLAHQEIGHYRRRVKRHVDGRVPISELKDVLAEVRSTVRSTVERSREMKVRRLREALSEDDRALLILRLDRGLPWAEIAFVLADLASPPSRPSSGVLEDEERRRHAARLRKRFQLLKERLRLQIRQEGIVPDRAV
jgi:RNA polymerase sigma-70 factor, ECF subfamily